MPFGRSNFRFGIDTSCCRVNSISVSDGTLTWSPLVIVSDPAPASAPIAAPLPPPALRSRYLTLDNKDPFQEIDKARCYTQIAMADTTVRKRAFAPWMGLLLTVLGALSNWLPFTGFPAAPVPWISLLLSLIGFVVVLFGLWQVFGQSTVYKGKLSSALATGFSLLFLAGAIVFFWSARHIPRESAAAPQVGQRVPDFTLPDSTGHSVSLTQLFSGSASKEPPKALLLVFYRGYW